jgi:GWxTD domain-containing protein
MKKNIICLFLLFSFLLSCATYRLEKNLDPVSKEFYTKVRYIITKQERKIFLNLPPTDRESFIEEFWKKRDPDPQTEENEYKTQYFNRIEEANTLFKEGSTPGWLQDRGRVYITLGPPTNRETYPRGTTFYGVPTEIWYYGFFPVVFRDVNWTGNYRMEALSAQHYNEINRAQVEWQPKVPKQKIVFDFDVELVTKNQEQRQFEIKIPYNNIWFAEKEDVLETTLEINMEASDEKGKKVWEYKKGEKISLTPADLDKNAGEDYILEINLDLKPGNYSLIVEIQNKTGGEKVRKNLRFTI